MPKMQMTAYERVMAVINRKDFDVFPAINPTSVATLDAMRIANAFFPETHTDSAKMAALASVGHDYFGFDSVTPYFSVHLESAALGAKTDWRDASNMPRVVTKPMRRVDDFKLPANFMNRTEFQRLLRTIKILKKKYAGQVPVIGKVIGPWTLAYNLYGVENLIIDMILEPRKTAELINELMVVPIEFAKAQFNAGADIITWAEHATSDLVSRHVYDEFILPVHQKATLALRGGGPIILHVCGNVMDRLPSIIKAGFPLFHMDSRNDIPKALEIVGDRLLITGGINNPLTLGQGSALAVSREAESNLADGIKLVSPECALPFNVPKQNLQELTKVIHLHSPSSQQN